MQSENLVIVSLLAMDWVEVVASVVGIIIVLNWVGYWRATFISELYVPRYVSGILPLLRFGLRYPKKQDLILESR